MSNSPPVTVFAPFSDDDNHREPENFYLWGYQPNFAISLKIGAKQLFESIDDRLFQDVFLVAINLADESKHPSAVVEPPHHPMSASDFGNVVALARESELASPGVSYSYPVGSRTGEAWAKRSQRRDFVGRVRGAVRQVVEGSYQHDGVAVFVSPGRVLDPYAVYSVLLLREAVRDEHPRLHRARRGDYRVQVSFIDSVAEQFVRQCWDALPASLDGQGMIEFPSPYETLRAAADAFMQTPFSACDNFNGVFGGFQVFNEISTLTYEKSAGRSRLLLARKGHTNINPSITFTHPIRLRDYRAVRKSLELAGSGEGLVCDSECVLGLGTLCGNYDTADEDLFTIEFVGHAKWQLMHANNPLLRVEHGIPQLPRKKRQVQKIVETFDRLFPGYGATSERRLGHLANIAPDLTHGAVFILSEDAAEEAARFGSQATGIEPTSLTPELLQQASRIDGAILAAPDGTCHAIGVILDGPVNEKGTAERGARFNSTVRYVLARNCACMGVVVSDDGTVDVVPEYRPRMSKREIDRQIAALQSLARESSVSRRSLNRLIDWFSEHRFYLSAEQCEVVNQAVVAASNKGDDSSAQRVFHPLEPNCEMNSSFLLP